MTSSPGYVFVEIRGDVVIMNYPEFAIEAHWRDALRLSQLLAAAAAAITADGPEATFKAALDQAHAEADTHMRRMMDSRAWPS